MKRANWMRSCRNGNPIEQTRPCSSCPPVVGLLRRFGARADLWTSAGTAPDQLRGRRTLRPMPLPPRFNMERLNPRRSPTGRRTGSVNNRVFFRRAATPARLLTRSTALELTRTRWGPSTRRAPDRVTGILYREAELPSFCLSALRDVPFVAMV